MAPPNICTNPRLDGFADVPIQLSHHSAWNQTFEPTNAIAENAPITFTIPPSPQFINLSRTRLKIKVKLTAEDGSPLINDETNTTDKGRFALVCNPIASLFKSAKLLVQGTTLTPSGDFYGYKAFIDTLFSATQDSKHTLDMNGFVLDSAEAHNNTNDGFKTRAKLANGSAVMEFSGRPAIDVLKNGKNLINNVKVEFIFYPQTHEFCIQRASTSTKNAKYQIMEAKLTIRKEELDPTVSQIINSNLLKKNWLLTYPMTSIKMFNIPTGSYQFTANNIFLGKVPNFILVYFVKAAGFTGDVKTNPFWFSPGEDIRTIIVTKDGVPIPNMLPPSICLSEDDGLELTDTYESLLDVNGKSGLTSTGLYFPQSKLAKGLFFYGANFQPDTENDDHVSPRSDGTVDVKVIYNKGTAEAYEMMVFGEHDVRTEITAARNVLHTFPL